MRAYALGVAVALVGRPACVHCGATVSLTQGEVDRTVPGACYKPGSVIMTCRACNNARNTETLAGETRYVADVARASVGVTMMGPTAARRLYLSVKDEGQLGASPYKSA